MNGDELTRQAEGMSTMISRPSMRCSTTAWQPPSLHLVSL